MTWEASHMTSSLNVCVREKECVFALQKYIFKRRTVIHITTGCRFVRSLSYQNGGHSSSLIAWIKRGGMGGGGEVLQCNSCCPWVGVAHCWSLGESAAGVTWFRWITSVCYKNNIPSLISYVHCSSFFVSLPLLNIMDVHHHIMKVKHQILTFVFVLPFKIFDHVFVFLHLILQHFSSALFQNFI